MNVRDAAGNTGGSEHGEGPHSFDGIILDSGAIIATIAISSTATASLPFTLITSGLGLIIVSVIVVRKRREKI